MDPGVRLLVLALGASVGATAPACDGAAGGQGGAAVTEAAVSHLPGDPIPDSVFAGLVRDLSEPDRYFDTDNLISNEASYLHVVDELERRGVRGGAYLGVGPGQNFSYMATVRPSLAFLIDLRRDNLLQHLWYKALFERAATRLDYLCLLVARRCGGDAEGVGIEALVARVEEAPPVDEPDALIDGVVETAASTGVPLDDDDRAFIRSIHQRFAAEGFGLRFRSHGRAPRPGYPTLRRLLLERDRSGRRSHYLARAEEYRYLRALQRANRVIPVVGDLAGEHAVQAVGRELTERGEAVSAYYVSNVEFYLFGERRYDAFVANLRALPVREDAVLIRSYFNRFRALPQTVPGHTSTQLLHDVPTLLRDWAAGDIRSYRELVARSAP